MVTVYTTGRGFTLTVFNVSRWLKSREMSKLYRILRLPVSEKFMYNLIFLWEFRNFKFKAPFFVRMYGAANIYTLNNCFSLISSYLLKTVLKWLIYEFHMYLDYRMKKCRDVYRSQFPFRLNKSWRAQGNSKARGIGGPLLLFVVFCPSSR